MGREMKVPGTFCADMTTFTTLLRELSHSGDAPGRMTYDDSVARPSERRVTKSERRRGRFGFRRGHNVAGGRVAPQLKIRGGIHEQRFASMALRTRSVGP